LTDTTSFIAPTSMANVRDTTTATRKQITIISTVSNNNRIASDLNKESKSSQTGVYIGVGVIVGLIILLLIILGVRYFKNRSKLNNSSENSIINATDVVYSNPENTYEIMSNTKTGEMVVNELYVSADAKNSSLPATTDQEPPVYSTPMKRRNP